MNFVMGHDTSLITTLAAAFGLAMALGLVAARLRLPPLVGYLVAGIAIGPGTPGFVADVGLAAQLAEVGVILLMFGVGLHLSLDDLLAVRRVVVPGAILQVATATVLGAAAALLWGWGGGAALVFGLSLSCASTVVLLRTLENRGAIASLNGRLAVGWLIVQDLAMVLVLVLLPPLAGLLGAGEQSGGAAGAGGPGAGGAPLWVALGVTLGKLAGFMVLMLVVGRRLLPRLLFGLAKVGSRELFTLGVVATAVCVAYVAARLFDVSFALGAFFAGLLLRESEFSHRAADELLPLRDAFSVLFFVSVGMLFEPRVLLLEPARVLVVVAIVMIGTPLAVIALVLGFRYPLNTALTVGVGLAQIGEFSFMVAALGVRLGFLPAEGQSLVLAGALASITLNTFVFKAVEPLQEWVRARSSLARRLERRDDPLAELPGTTDPSRLEGQIVVVGCGRVGRRIVEALVERGIPFVVAEQNREVVEELRARDIAAVSGDAADPMVLAQAHILRARMLVVAAPDTFAARQMVDIARRVNPTIEIVLRTHSEEEADLLRRDSLGTVFMGEHELALAMIRHVLDRRAAREGKNTGPVARP